MPGKHAKKSPSAADRLIHCPGSLKLSQLFPESTSDAAAEGTLAHKLAEGMITNISNYKQPLEGLDPILNEIEVWYAEHPDTKGSAKIMVETLSPYVDYVFAEYLGTRGRDEATSLETEISVDFSDAVGEPGSKDYYGQADVVIIGDDKIEVIDLKYGKGVAVSAENNPQIRLYALGAIAAYDILYRFTEVKMVIYQPRFDSVTEETLTVEELKAWALDVVAPAFKAADLENPPYHPGYWCKDKFCPAAGTCRARAEYVLALERYSGKEPGLLTPEELDDVLHRLDVLDDFGSKARGYALGELEAGREIPGWKIVEGRSKRRYKDEEAVAAALYKSGLFKNQKEADAMIYERSLIGITAMEKLISKKQFAALLETEKNPLVVKGEGPHKLAPVSDARPALHPREHDFDD